MKGLIRKFVKYSCLFSSCLAIGLTSCDDEESNEVTSSKSQESRSFEKVEISPSKMLTMSENYNSYAWNLLGAIYEKEADSNKNYFISPLSMGIDLAMLQNGAKGETLDEILSGIGFENYSSAEVNGYFCSVIENLQTADSSVQFNLANAMYYNEPRGIYFDSTFSSFLAKDYDALMKGGDFGDPSLLSEINQWCSDQTNGKITDVLSDLDEANGILELLNAVYLKADWTEPFIKGANDVFNLNGGESVKVDYMYIVRDLPYYENENLQYVEVPLAGGSFVAFFALPAKEKSISDLISYMQSNWSSILAGKSNKTVDLSMPKFETEYKIEGEALKSALNLLGIKNAFIPGDGDFSGIFDLSKSNVIEAYVANIIQESKFSINENGIEAASVTVLELGDTAFYVNISMLLNRSFVFGIRDTKTNSILFSGCLNNPAKEE